MSQTNAPAFSELARFASLLKDFTSASDTGLRLDAFRQRGLERATRLGFPTTSQEEWRYTNLEPVARLPFQPAPVARGALPVAAELGKYFTGGAAARRLVFVDGAYAPSLSSPGPALAGLKLGNIAQHGVSVADCLDRCAGAYENFMGALNSAFFTDGAYISAETGVVVPEPIQLLFISTRAGAGFTYQPRNWILAAANARLAVIESYVSLDAGAYVTNAMTEVVAGAGAQVEHVRLQNESLEAFHFGGLHATLGRHTRFNSHSISLGARLARQDLRAVFAEAGGYALFNGLYLTQGSQLTDHHTLMDHAKPHCESHEYYHGILDDRSKGVFNGKIIVRLDAQKTDAKQTNRNLLLSDQAVIDTKPQLEIFADDVKCTHGATVGQLDEDSVFYLRSRGIGAVEARRMLIHAFARAVIQRVETECLRSDLDRLILAKLGGGKDEHE
jgi:Fe-S cluster assembly protein SufD